MDPDDIYGLKVTRNHEWEETFYLVPRQGRIEFYGKQDDGTIRPAGNMEGRSWQIHNGGDVNLWKLSDREKQRLLEQIASIPSTSTPSARHG